MDNIVETQTFDDLLNKKINSLYDEWDALQQKCEHIYENGKCVVCGKEGNK